MLLRPVIKYKIPHDKGFLMQHRFSQMITIGEPLSEL